jgi:hypothetical protein
MQTSQMNKAMQECIQNCIQCHAICVQTVSYCLQKGGPHAEATHIQTLLDCTQTCEICSDLMLRNSPLRQKTCALCADACNRCAQSCERLGAGDAQMTTCVEVCRRCESSCKQMASMV